MNKILTYLVLSAFLLNSFRLTPLAKAQDYYLPQPGVMVRLSPPLNPPMLKGIKVHHDDPFRFEFILDKGDSQLSNDELKSDSGRLIKYFLASLTISGKDLWVNLSPYEKDRIIPKSFGLTEMGRDLLAEDYMLKQITASLIYPEDEVGKKFWKRVYEEAARKYGTTDIAVNTFNKVWIVPEKAVVYENAKLGAAYVFESKLKVMLEEDYLAMEKQLPLAPSLKNEGGGVNSISPLSYKEGIQGSSKDINALGSQIVREIIIPELTMEVNENKNFAPLRQVYNSLILATWYKNKIKDSILERVYADRSKVAGVSIDDPREKQRIYERYLRAFKKGVFNYIKEELDILSQEAIPRKYFSGGVAFFNLAMLSREGKTDLNADGAMKVSEVTSAEVSGINTDNDVLVSARVQSEQTGLALNDKAMIRSPRVRKVFRVMLTAVSLFLVSNSRLEINHVKNHLQVPIPALEGANDGKSYLQKQILAKVDREDKEELSKLNESFDAFLSDQKSETKKNDLVSTFDRTLFSVKDPDAAIDFVQSKENYELVYQLFHEIPMAYIRDKINKGYILKHNDFHVLVYSVSGYRNENAIKIINNASLDGLNDKGLNSSELDQIIGYGKHNPNLGKFVQDVVARVKNGLQNGETSTLEVAAFLESKGYLSPDEIKIEHLGGLKSELEENPEKVLGVLRDLMGSEINDADIKSHQTNEDYIMYHAGGEEINPDVLLPKRIFLNSSFQQTRIDGPFKGVFKRNPNLVKALQGINDKKILELAKKGNEGAVLTLLLLSQLFPDIDSSIQELLEHEARQYIESPISYSSFDKIIYRTFLPPVFYAKMLEMDGLDPHVYYLIGSKLFNYLNDGFTGPLLADASGVINGAYLKRMISMVNSLTDDQTQRDVMIAIVKEAIQVRLDPQRITNVSAKIKDKYGEPPRGSYVAFGMPHAIFPILEAEKILHQNLAYKGNVYDMTAGAMTEGFLVITNNMVDKKLAGTGIESSIDSSGPMGLHILGAVWNKLVDDKLLPGWIKPKITPNGDAIRQTGEVYPLLELPFIADTFALENLGVLDDLRSEEMIKDVDGRAEWNNYGYHLERLKGKYSKETLKRIGELRDRDWLRKVAVFLAGFEALQIEGARNLHVDEEILGYFFNATGLKGIIYLENAGTKVNENSPLPLKEFARLKGERKAEQELLPSVGKINSIIWTRTVESMGQRDRGMVNQAMRSQDQDASKLVLDLANREATMEAVQRVSQQISQAIASGVVSQAMFTEVGKWGLENGSKEKRDRAMPETIVLNDNQDISEKMKRIQELVSNGKSYRITAFHGKTTNVQVAMDEAHPETLGTGFYLTDKISAENYADFRTKEFGGNPVLESFRLDSLKLLVLEDNRLPSEIEKAWRAKLMEILEDDSTKRFVQLAASNIYWNVPFGAHVTELQRAVQDYFTGFLQSQGYEGLVAREAGEGEKRTPHISIVVFDRNSLKIKRDMAMNALGSKVIRLYRVFNPNAAGAVIKGQEKYTGQWFSSDLDYVLDYIEKNYVLRQTNENKTVFDYSGLRLSYIDLTIAQAEKYLLTPEKIVQEKLDAEIDNFIIPPATEGIREFDLGRTIGPREKKFHTKFGVMSDVRKNKGDVRKLLESHGIIQSQAPFRDVLEYAELFKSSEKGEKDNSQLGGIDLTPANMNLKVQNAGEPINFHLNPAQLAQLQNTRGFVPVIIKIQPMRDLRNFLGVEK